MTNGSMHFNCARHRGENVSTQVKPGGSQARQVYEKAVKVLTLHELGELKGQYSSEAAVYLGKVPDAAQYMVACGELHGESVNSTVEAMNAVNEPVRKGFDAGIHMTAALLTTVKLCGRRFYENKRKAHAATGQLPSAVWRKLEPVIAKAATINSGVSFPMVNCKGIARVESTPRPGVGYTSWQAQYPADLQYPTVPILAEVDAHELYDPASRNLNSPLATESILIFQVKEAYADVKTYLKEDVQPAAEGPSLPALFPLDNPEKHKRLIQGKWDHRENRSGLTSWLKLRLIERRWERALLHRRLETKAARGVDLSFWARDDLVATRGALVKGDDLR
eukprot:gene12387-biopygen12739